MQVSSATATFTMMFSSSMSVVEYYLLHRFPVPYGTIISSYAVYPLASSHLISYIFLVLFHPAAYFTAVAFVAAITGQHCVRKLITWLGRASLIIFILASMIFVSALTLGTISIHALLKLTKIILEQLYLYLITLLMMKSMVDVLACRRGWHLKHSSQDGAASVHGLRKPL